MVLLTYIFEKTIPTLTPTLLDRITIAAIATTSYAKEHQLLIAMGAISLFHNYRHIKIDNNQSNKRKRRPNSTKITTKRANSVLYSESDTDHDNTDSDSDDDRKLQKGWKTRAPEIANFSGKQEDWSKWKLNTRSVLYGLGYRRILNNHDYAKRHKVRNGMLFTLFHKALEGGHSDNLTFNKEHNDGNRVWTALLQYYDGDPSIKAGIATQLHEKLRKCVMVQGVSAEQYVNSFRKLNSQIQEQEGFELDPDIIKQLFVKNIQDPDYSLIKQTMQMDLNNKTMNKLVSELRTHELTMETADRTAKRPRRTGSTPTETEEPKTSLPSIIHPNTLGIIKIQPFEAWRTLKKEHRTFLQTHNSAARHNKELPTPPAGITIGPTKGTPVPPTAQSNGI